MLDVQKEVEQKWIEQAQKGNQDAFAELFQLHYSFLYKYLLKVTMNREMTEDLIQETMLKCYDGIKRYDGRSKFSSWLITIATRLYIDHLRRRKTEQAWMKKEKTSLIRQLRWQTEKNNIQWFVVMELLAQMKEDVRLAILLKHYYGFTNDEIAAMLKMKVGTVKSKIHYGLKVLRKELTKDESERG